MNHLLEKTYHIIMKRKCVQLLPIYAAMECPDESRLEVRPTQVSTPHIDNRTYYKQIQYSPLRMAECSVIA